MTDTVDPADAGLSPEGLDKLDASIQSDIDNGLNYGAALLVGRGGRIVHRRNFGTVAPGRAAADGDRYMHMSMSKAFTATLVWQAITAGRFDLDTRVADLVPAFGNGGKQEATIHQLLNHTAGLPTAPVAPPLPLQAMGHLARHAEAICRLKAAYQPGTACAYTSGTGYDMLGRILELTDPSHRPFGTIARQDLFEPLGMTNTAFGCALDDPRRVPVTATPASSVPATEVSVPIFNQIGPDADYPCAGAFGDVDDVFKFTESLAGRGPQVIAPEAFALARRNSTGDMVMRPQMVGGLASVRQMVATLGVKKFIDVARKMRSGGGIPDVGSTPVHFTLLGGYTRGDGNIDSTAGRNASPSTITAIGGGSTGWLLDTERDLTVVFLSAGLMETEHFNRMQRINGLANAAVTD